VTFVIPGLFYSEIFKESRDIGNVSSENRPLFNEMISEKMIGQKIPGILAQGEEFAKMKVRNKDELQMLANLKNMPIIQATVPEPIKGRDVFMKPICILMAYMCGMLQSQPENAVKSTEENIFTDLEVILRAVPSYLDIMIEECLKLVEDHKKRQTHKKITAGNILGIL